MFGFKKKKPDSDTNGYFRRIAAGLKKTRSNLLGGVRELVGSSSAASPETLEDIENRLLMADVGIESCTRIRDALEKQARRESIDSIDGLLACLHEQMVAILDQNNAGQELPVEGLAGPAVILVVGVNGVGKTTTIGKLARLLHNQGLGVLLAAGDTFRAAAIEQLNAWGEKHDIPVIAQQQGADSAAVIFDALQAARARSSDVLIADTAGRLHNKDNLMEELKKIRRTISRFDDTLPVEVLLVVDAGTGQNALAQTQLFHEAVGLTGIVLTKLDGTAKGGVALALASRFDIPIRFIGVGEGADDLRPFDSTEFVHALLGTDP